VLEDVVNVYRAVRFALAALLHDMAVRDNHVQGTAEGVPAMLVIVFVH
jgi:hypothetical protein